MAKKYQTLSGFLLSPFHGRENLERDQKYDNKYRQFVLNNRIRIHSMTRLEGSYYYHIKVPSESQKSETTQYEYDVIIRFFTDDEEVKKQPHLRGYYVQFFSNSPSFMYQYAYLYKQEGYLIEALYSKLDPDYIDTPPKKTNVSMSKSYDKSIYFACRYLSEKKFRYLEKHGVITMKEISETKFFRQITDFKSVKMDQVLISEEKKLAQNLKKMKKPRNLNKKQASLSSLKNKSNSAITYVKKTGGKNSGHIKKKKPVKSTVKR